MGEAGDVQGGRGLQDFETVAAHARTGSKGDQLMREAIEAKMDKDWEESRR